MWTPPTRQQHSRPLTRYQTDLTDAEWCVIAPHLPRPCATGRPREWPMREIVNGIFYVMRAGCPWRLLPNDFPPWETIYRWFAAWRDDGRFERINHALVMADRERAGRDASPSAAIIDCQSVKTTEAGGARGYDAGKKVNGRKRHALVDTDGRGLVLEPHPASVQDRDGGCALLSLSRRLFPFIERVFADSGYAGEKVAKATLIAVEIVRVCFGAPCGLRSDISRSLKSAICGHGNALRPLIRSNETLHGSVFNIAAVWTPRTRAFNLGRFSRPNSPAV